MKRLVGDTSGYYLLAGDLNAEPGTPPITLLNNSQIMNDLWAYMWGTAESGYTFTSGSPTKRIDYIFSSPALSALCSKIVIVGTTPEGSQPKVYASDHYGVLATFNLDIPNDSPSPSLEGSFYFV
eukprot:TRINITY_DN10997_c0_g1_i1.p1 TRINITY_DN10997_c0_g1~~TRINITY_DN10997_c0_g1_i1.p1  ORF type:complete len:125 (-),score=27.26 TRINITY_DN10997_c0_g1_i1:140-514(-)